MQVSVNGIIQQTQSKTLWAFVAEQSGSQTIAAATTKMAVAVNGKVILQQDWANFEISENDVIDVFQAVAGG